MRNSPLVLMRLKSGSGMPRVVRYSPNLPAHKSSGRIALSFESLIIFFLPPQLSPTFRYSSGAQVELDECCSYLVRSLASMRFCWTTGGSESKSPIDSSFMLFLCSSSTSDFSALTRSFIKVETSFLGRFQFSVENVYSVRYLTLSWAHAYYNVADRVNACSVSRNPVKPFFMSPSSVTVHNMAICCGIYYPIPSVVF